MRYANLPPLAGILFSLAACTDHSPVGPSALAANASNAATAASTPWARIVEGETGPGSLYALYIPEKWNGEAVYYVHGIRPPLAPITLADQDNFFEVRDALGAQGYAFAYSSFSENGLAVKDGAQRTHQLRGLLQSQLPSKAQRNYVVGYSLGALIAMELGQKFPTQYDGVLAMCGMVGGTPRELQYVGDVRALFDAYYPGVLPGNAISAPSIPPTSEQVQAAVIAAITQAPLGLYAIASTAQTPLAFVPGNIGDPNSQAFQSLVGSLVYALYYQLLGTPDVLDRTHGHSPYDNRNTVYTMGTPVAPVPQLVPIIASMIAASNQTVARFDITPDAANYLDKYYVPSGNLPIPVVSVHNLWDPLVPYPIHEPPFAQAVTDAGSSAMLTSQAVPNYGHCNFPTSLVLDSFKKLVDKVNPTS